VIASVIAAAAAKIERIAEMAFIGACPMARCPVVEKPHLGQTRQISALTLK
jgi:hypothetical protein